MNWNNPDDDFIGVQINRNINFLALSIDQGDMIYSGNQESFEDMDAEDGIKAKITLYELNKEESWEIWSAKKYNQENPQITGYESTCINGSQLKELLEKVQTSTPVIPTPSIPSPEPTIIPVCDTENINLCNTQELCEGVNFYWHTDTCNTEAEIIEDITAPVLD